MPHDDSDSIDIYSDLPLFNSETLKKLEEQNKVLKSRIASLEDKLQSTVKEKAEVEKHCNQLKLNLSSLLKTAQSEINRKDVTINELRRKYDDAIFRRAERSRNSHRRDECSRKRSRETRKLDSRDHGGSRHTDSGDDNYGKKARSECQKTQSQFKINGIPDVPRPAAESKIRVQDDHKEVPDETDSKGAKSEETFESSILKTATWTQSRHTPPINATIPLTEYSRRMLKRIQGASVPESDNGVNQNLKTANPVSAIPKMVISPPPPALNEIAVGRSEPKLEKPCIDDVIVDSESDNARVASSEGVINFLLPSDNKGGVIVSPDKSHLSNTDSIFSSTINQILEECIAPGPVMCEMYSLESMDRLVSSPALNTIPTPSKNVSDTPTDRIGSEKKNGIKEQPASKLDVPTSDKTPLKSKKKSKAITPISQLWSKVTGFKNAYSSNKNVGKDLTKPLEVSLESKTKSQSLMESIFGSPLKWTEEDDENVKDCIITASDVEDSSSAVSKSARVPEVISETLTKAKSIMKYEDTTLGQFEDTIQFVSALSVPAPPHISPLSTPNKSLESLQISQTSQCSGISLTNPDTSATDPFASFRSCSKPDSPRSVNILVPRKEKRVLSSQPSSVNPSSSFLSMFSSLSSLSHNQTRLSSLDDKAINAVCHLVSYLEDTNWEENHKQQKSPKKSSCRSRRMDHSPRKSYSRLSPCAAQSKDTLSQVKTCSDNNEENNDFSYKSEKDKEKCDPVEINPDCDTVEVNTLKLFKSEEQRVKEETSDKACLNKVTSSPLLDFQNLDKSKTLSTKSSEGVSHHEKADLPDISSSLDGTISKSAIVLNENKSLNCFNQSIKVGSKSLSVLKTDSNKESSIKKRSNILNLDSVIRDPIIVEDNHDVKVTPSKESEQNSKRQKLEVKENTPNSLNVTPNIRKKLHKNQEMSAGRSIDRISEKVSQQSSSAESTPKGKSRRALLIEGLPLITKKSYLTKCNPIMRRTSKKKLDSAERIESKEVEKGKSKSKESSTRQSKPHDSDKKVQGNDKGSKSPAGSKGSHSSKERSNSVIRDGRSRSGRHYSSTRRGRNSGSWERSEKRGRNSKESSSGKRVYREFSLERKIHRLEKELHWRPLHKSAYYIDKRMYYAVRRGERGAAARREQSVLRMTRHDRVAQNPKRTPVMVEQVTMPWRLIIVDGVPDPPERIVPLHPEDADPEDVSNIAQSVDTDAVTSLPRNEDNSCPA